MNKPHLIIIEPFYGGSHKQLIDTITDVLNPMEYTLFNLPAKKWHWRARTSALYFSQIIPLGHEYKTLFTSSVLNLAEFLGLRPDLITCKKIVYFHENQLVYPTQDSKKRDVQYGLNEILTCLAADQVLFNSNFNKTSFMDNINRLLNVQPDFKLTNLREKIEPKCEVLYYPINFDAMQMIRRKFDDINIINKETPLHLIWPHRWEHDKNPELLVEVLLELNKRQVDFLVTICGENYQQVPECFKDIQNKLGSKLIGFGYLTREEYLKSLHSGDIVISTANHEFYGVSMLEASFAGCIPIAPNKLVYSEIYPMENLYNTSNQLIKKLCNWCRNPEMFRKNRKFFFEKFNFDLYSAKFLLPKYETKLKQ